MRHYAVKGRLCKKGAWWPVNYIQGIYYKYYFILLRERVMTVLAGYVPGIILLQGKAL